MEIQNDLLVDDNRFREANLLLWNGRPPLSQLDHSFSIHQSVTIAMTDCTLHSELIAVPKIFYSIVKIMTKCNYTMQLTKIHKSKKNRQISVSSVLT